MSSGFKTLPINCNICSLTPGGDPLSRQPIDTNIKHGFILDLCFGLRGPLLLSVSIFNELFFSQIFKGSFTASTHSGSSHMY